MIRDPFRKAGFRLALAAVVLAAGPARALDYPPTPKKPTTETFHGVTVTDDYRWLEDGNAPAVQTWTEAENRLTRAYLDALPQRPALERRFKELLGEAPVRYFEMYRRGAFFAMKRQPPKNQPFLVVRKSAGNAASERVLVDPNVLNPKGTTAIDFYVPSLDGRYVAVAMSEDGSEAGPASVFEVATGRKLADVVPRVEYPTGGGSIEWDAAGEGFYYTRYPQGKERPPADANFYQQVYYHRLGTPASKDRYVIGKEFPRIAETALHATPDGKWLLASVANGDGGEFSFWLRDPKGRWTRVAGDRDRIRRMALGLDGRLYALSLLGAPRGRLLAIPLAHPDLAHAEVIVPEGRDTIEEVLPTRTRLYVEYMAGGPSEVRFFGLDGKALGTLPTEPVSTVYLGARLHGDAILVGSQSYVSPPAWYRYAPSAGTLVRTDLAGRPNVDFDDAEVVRETARSKDGTPVPMNILMKKGTRRDGTNPVLLYGYGGYGVSERPYFSLGNRVWLDHGGVFVDANLRGGGEFGEAWHLAGNLTRKQNVFDDMIACAEHLVSRGYTTPARLAAMGASNGGLLMGAILTQRPDLFRAVVAEVGIYDMLRVETTPNGAFNVTEFGSVKDPEQFRALYAYSPYHHVKAGVAYPAVLLTAGTHDGRVDPYNSRKMAARLQAATSSGRPILLRMSATTGHGIGTALDTRVEEYADIYAFLTAQLGMRRAP